MSKIGMAIVKNKYMIIPYRAFTIWYAICRKMCRICLLYQTNNLTQSLTDILTSIGENAYESGTPICFFMDEFQFRKAEELSLFIAALH